MSNHSVSPLVAGLSWEDRELVAREWIRELADADRLAGLDGQGLVSAARTLEEVGRIADAGRVFVTGLVEDLSRRELGDQGLARTLGYKDTAELLEREAGTPSRQTRQRVRESGPLQPARNTFTGKVERVAFPVLRAAVGAGLVSAELSTAITGVLGPLRDRGSLMDQAWMRARIARLELELAVLALGTRIVLDHAEVFDRVPVSGDDAQRPSVDAPNAQDAGMTTSARMLALARQVGAGRHPAPHERVRRVALGHKDALLSLLAQRAPGERERRHAERLQAEAQRYVSLTQRHDGMWDLKGIVTPEWAAQVSRIRDAVLDPKKQRTPAVPGLDSGGANGAGHASAGDTDAIGYDQHGVPVGADGRTLPVDQDGNPVRIRDPRSAGQRFHDAIIQFATVSAAAAQAGTLQGANPTLVITCSVDQIDDPAGIAFLQGTHDEATSSVDASAARRAGCAGTIQKALMDHQGRILQMHTHGRIFTEHQRTAIALRDGGCAWPGCNVPSTWTEIHHVAEWAKGGPTSIDNGVSVCFHHHRDLETLGWNIEMRHGVPWFQPPPTVDPDQHWIRGQQSAHVIFDQARRRIALLDADADSSSGPTAGPGTSPDAEASLGEEDTRDCDAGPDLQGWTLPATGTDGTALLGDPWFEHDGRRAPTSALGSRDHPGSLFDLHS